MAKSSLGQGTLEPNQRLVHLGAALEQLFRDVRFGLRLLRREPGFAATTVLTLTLAIGATTTIFSVVNAVLLQAAAVPGTRPSRDALADRSEQRQPFRGTRTGELPRLARAGDQLRAGGGGRAVSRSTSPATAHRRSSTRRSSPRASSRFWGQARRSAGRFFRKSSSRAAASSC